MATPAKNLEFMEFILPRLALKVVAAMMNMDFIGIEHGFAMLAPAALGFDDHASVFKPLWGLKLLVIGHDPILRHEARRTTLSQNCRRAPNGIYSQSHPHRHPRPVPVVEVVYC